MNTPAPHSCASDSAPRDQHKVTEPATCKANPNTLQPCLIPLSSSSNVKQSSFVHHRNDIILCSFSLSCIVGFLLLCLRMQLPVACLVLPFCLRTVPLLLSCGIFSCSLPPSLRIGKTTASKISVKVNSSNLDSGLQSTEVVLN